MQDLLKSFDFKNKIIDTSMIRKTLQVGNKS